MSERVFIVKFKEGGEQMVRANFGDQDDEEDGYVFFVDSDGQICALFQKPFVESWYEQMGTL